MRLKIALLLNLLLPALPLSGQTLDIYFIDVEGGQATLYVSPSGESMLVDTGWPGDRDPARIAEVLRVAGIRQIDRMVLSHYHIDHFGGLENLSRLVPILHFYDHGPSPETDRPAIQTYERTYAEIHAGSPRTVVKPGDRIPFAGAEVLVVASHDEYLGAAIPGAPGAGSPNADCAAFRPLERPEPDPDNDHSIGFVVSYGSFRTINLGDLTWNREPRLMCPNNLVGTVDVYLTSHHGVDRSGSPALVHALRPRVAIMNNGHRKGGSVPGLRTLHTSPGIEDVWQLHWSHHGSVEYNPPGLFIANIDEPSVLAGVLDPPAEADGRAAANQSHEPAHWIMLSARADGSFTVTNSRNGFSKGYRAASSDR
jgi:competence protein ComEC